ncbi:MAG: hypothetical protein ACNS60_19735 [Candidatus Cyclobacteriaceae bacterium M2_1C_046]
MNIIRKIEIQFTEIENEYSSKIFEAHRRGYYKKEDEWVEKLELFTHAYFLFLFTRLENHITNEVSSLIDFKRGSIRHWKSRAIWDNVNINNLHFKKKVGLLTQIGQNDFNRIIDYYNYRNHIAHGGIISSITSTINMATVFSDFKMYFQVLKR